MLTEYQNLRDTEKSLLKESLQQSMPVSNKQHIVAHQVTRKMETDQIQNWQKEKNNKTQRISK